EEGEGVGDGEGVDVDGAAPVNEPVLDGAAERVDRPELLVVRNDVSVIEQNNWALAPVPAQTRPDRAAAGKRLEDLMLDAFALADAGEEIRRANLIARRIGSVDLEVLNKEIEGFPLNLVPIDFVIGRAGAARRDVRNNGQTQ